MGLEFEEIQMRLPARMHVHKLERDLLLVEARENPRHIREERPRAVDINRGGSHGLRVRKTHKLEALSPSSGSLCSLMVERFLPLLQGVTAITEHEIACSVKQ